jgi:hypothetical protein
VEHKVSTRYQGQVQLPSGCTLQWAKQSFDQRCRANVRNAVAGEYERKTGSMSTECGG